MGKTTMHKIDMNTWPRAELFRFFSGVSQPFYSVTFRVDVTNLHAYTKARGISFYYALGYLVTDAVNSVVNFRYTIRDGEVWLLDKRIPSLTDLKPGSEQFHIVTLPKTGTLDEFCCVQSKSGRNTASPAQSPARRSNGRTRKYSPCFLRTRSRTRYLRARAARRGYCRAAQWPQKPPGRAVTP